MKIIFPLLSFLAYTCISAQDKINFAAAPVQPEVFASGIVSTGLSERDFALSPDGKELYYTMQMPQGLFQTIVCRKKNNRGEWGQPAIVSFAGHYSDLEPALSADGKLMYFASNRPVNGTAVKDFDIWVVEKINGQWGVPKNIGSPVNTGADEFYPSVARNGNLYYTAAYKGGPGKEDIYVARYENGLYKAPVSLDSAINSKLYEFNAFVSPDEDYIIFTSYGRKDDKGKGDLYMSRKDPSGRWQPAVNLVALNSDKLDYCPFVSPDGKMLFFTSERINIPQSYPGKAQSVEGFKKMINSPQNGNGDIYWIRFDQLEPAGLSKDR